MSHHLYLRFPQSKEVSAFICNFKMLQKSGIKKLIMRLIPPPLMFFRVHTSLFYLHRNTYPRSTWVRERMAKKESRGKIYWDWGSGECSLFLSIYFWMAFLFIYLSLPLHHLPIFIFLSLNHSLSLSLFLFTLSFPLPLSLHLYPSLKITLF